MNTIHDMRNLLFHLYCEGLEQISDDSINMTEEEKNDNFSKVMDYIVEYIIDYDEKEAFMSLATAYYYLLEIPVKETKFENEEDNCFLDLISIIEEEDYEVILDGLEAEQHRFLYEILSYIIDNDLKYYTHKEENLGNDIEDYLEYISFNNITNREIYDVLLKLHPNTTEEKDRFKKYLSDNDLLSKISNFKIKSLSYFIQVFMMLKNQFTYKSYLGDYVTNVLEDLLMSNEELYKNILIYIIKYTYVQGYLYHKECLSNLDEMIAESMEDLYFVDKFYIEEFTNFDFNKFYIDYSKLPEDVKNYINNTITTNKLVTYGINGRWSLYKEEDYNILKNSLNRIDYDNNTKKEIYYSIDEDGNYTIPRLCIELEDNKVINIVGRDIYGNIEFELISILKDKLEEYDNSDYLQSELLLLDKLYEIEQKLKMKMELTVEDIDLLYEINFDLDEILFSNYQYKINLLREETDIKKNLSKYFNCPEDLIALEQCEITDKTVITTFFFPNGPKCNYPNLKIIFSDAWGDFLDTAEGLPSLEYIKGDAMFANIKSSYGLSNLVRIDGNAIFTSLEDDSYFNSNLEIKGETEYPDDYESKHVKIK